MDNLSIFLAPIGFFIGMFVWSRVLRMGMSVWTVAKERGRDPTHRSRWRVGATLLLNSGIWTLAALIILADLILVRPHAPAWDMFFYGVLASVFFQGLIVLWMARKMKKRRTKEGST